MKLVLKELHNGGNTRWYDFIIDGNKVGEAWIRIKATPGDVLGNQVYYEIAEEHRNKGYDQNLFDALLKESKVQGMNGITVSCEDGNKPSLKIIENALGLPMKSGLINGVGYNQYTKTL